MLRTMWWWFPLFKFSIELYMYNDFMKRNKIIGLMGSLDKIFLSLAAAFRSWRPWQKPLYEFYLAFLTTLLTGRLLWWSSHYGLPLALLKRFFFFFLRDGSAHCSISKLFFLLWSPGTVFNKGNNDGFL